MQTSCDLDVGAGGVSSGIAEQIYHCWREVVHVAYPLHLSMIVNQGLARVTKWTYWGYLVHDLNNLRVLLSQLSGHVRLCVASRNRVDSDVLWRKLDG